MTATPSRPWHEGRPPAAVIVIRKAAQQFHITPRMLLSKSSTQPLPAARRLAMKGLHDLGYSTPMIGRVLGGLHHSTVVCGLQKRTKETDYSFPIPDYSGEWAI